MSAIAEKKPTYKIFVLSDDEFEGLHEDIPEVSKENLAGAMGFANPKTKEAYVRRTPHKQWTDEVIMHEAQELLLKTSPHEEDGIRYKKFFKEIGAPILATVVGSMIGAPYLGALGAPLGAAAASAIQQKTMTGRISPLQTGLAGVAGYLGGPGIKAGYAGVPAGTGILGKVGAGLKGMVTGGPKITPAPDLAKGAFSLAGDVAPGIPTQQAIRAGAIIPMPGAVYTPSTTAFPQVLGTALGALQKPPTTVGAPAIAPGVTPPTAAPGITPPVAPSAVTPAPAGLGAIAKRLATPEGILGAGALLAGAAPRAPEFEMPARIGELEQAFLTQRGISEVGQVARGELLKTLQARPEELYPVADDAFIQASLRGTKEAYERAQEQLDASYNIAGVYGSGEHLAAKDKLREELAQLESDFIALENQRRFTMAQTTKQQAIVTALQDAGLTEQQIMNIAALDVQQAAMQYGVEVSDMQVIKEALAGIGAELITGAFRPTTKTAIT